MEITEEIRVAISALMENFWIVKTKQPDEYHAIKRNKTYVQQYFHNRFGYRLVDAPNLFKLEKIPYVAMSWMGIKFFKNKNTYSLFTAFLAFLEERSPEDLFLIATAADYLKSFFLTDEPESFTLKWESHQHRSDFVDALQYAERVGLISRLDGNLDRYRDDEAVEVLYQPTLLAKHYLRFFTKPLAEFSKPEELLLDGWKEQKEAGPRENLHTINRRLFFSPVVYRDELTGEERRYFSNQWRTFAENIEVHTDYQLEIYRGELLLIAEQRGTSGEEYPDQKAVSEIALHFGSLVRGKVLNMTERPDFSIFITKHEFNEWVTELQDEFRHGWHKNWRLRETEQLAVELLAFLEDWKLARYDEVSYSVELYPTIVRVAGEYPREFTVKMQGLEVDDDDNQ